jgi:anti-anti-sigma regulatory factor
MQMILSRSQRQLNSKEIIFTLDARTKREHVQLLLDAIGQHNSNADYIIECLTLEVIDDTGLTYAEEENFGSLEKLYGL